MASVYLRGKRWYIRYRDEHGHWSAKPCVARTKREAQEKAAELATEMARVRRTTDPTALLHREVPLRELLQWWIEHYVLKTPSGPKVAGTISKHLVDSPLGDVPLGQLTASHIEVLWHKKAL